MPPAEFEEPEYEGPLYNQLERQSSKLWAPGRVLERHIGFDRGLHVIGPLLWQLHGISRPRPGAALARYAWPAWWGGQRLRNPPQLPSFRLNVFLQAKRSYWSRACPAPARGLLAKGPVWSFSITPHQQRLLEEVDKRTAGRTLVAYAAPVFHVRRELYRHTRRGSIVSHSTFPSVSRLAGHAKWYYTSPGALGAANPDPELIDEPPFAARVAELAGRESREDNGSVSENLAALASHLIAAAASDTVPESEQRARFFDELLVIDRQLEGLDNMGEHLNFTRVAHFAETFELSWFVIE